MRSNPIAKRCTTCGRNFLTSTNVRTKCSPKCRNKSYRYKRHNIIKKTCKICDSDFRTSRVQRILCSQKCFKLNKTLILRKVFAKKKMNEKELEIYMKQEIIKIKNEAKVKKVMNFNKLPSGINNF